MALDFGFDFRASSGYVTDPAAHTYVLTSDVYPMASRGGSPVFGYVSNSGLNAVDRNAAVPRVAGIHYFNKTSSLQFQVDLPNAGSYKVYAAMGDAAGFDHPVKMEIFDNTSSLGVIITDQVTQVGGFIDGANVSFASQAAWAAGQAGSAALTFATTVFIAKLGPAAAPTADVNWTMSHLRIVEQVGGGGGVVIPVFMNQYRQRR